MLIAFSIGNSGGDEPFYEFVVRRMFKYEVLLDFCQKFVHSHRLLAAGRTRAGFHLKNLHSFWENQFSVHTLLCHKADHTVACIQLLEFRKGTSSTVADVLITKVTECDYGLSCGDCGNIRRGVDLIAEQPVDLARLE